jgi:hypothetical protein
MEKIFNLMTRNKDIGSKDEGNSELSDENIRNGEENKFTYLNDSKSLK